MGGLATATGHGVRDVARRLLDGGLQAITDEAVLRVHREEPAYSRSLVTISDLRHEMRRTLTVVLMRLAGDQPPADLASAASEVGRLRAEQGLALDALLHSFRLDLRILWASLVQEARPGEMGAREEALEAFQMVWEAVEVNTSQAVDSYRRTLHDRERSLDVVRSRVFDRLLNDGHLDPSSVREAAQQLGLPLNERILVAIGLGAPTDGRLTVSLGTRLAGRGVAGHVGWVGEELAAVVALGPLSEDEILELLGPLDCGRTAAVIVPTIADAHMGAQLVRRVAGSMSAPQIRLVNRNWVQALAVGNREVGTLIEHEVMRPIFHLPSAERALLLNTLTAYIDGDGSILRVAAQLHCHRNTIRNRLLSVERLTGLSLSRPRDVAVLAFALDWARSTAGRLEWPQK